VENDKGATHKLFSSTESDSIGAVSRSNNEHQKRRQPKAEKKRFQNIKLNAKSITNSIEKLQESNI
jgi:hypothetical protein